MLPTISKVGHRRSRDHCRGLPVAIALVALLGAGCAPSASPTASSAGRAPAASPTPRFDALVARARAAPDHEVTGFFEEFEPATVRMLEQKWQERFGFPITLNSIPGHMFRDAPSRVLAAYKSGQALVDVMGSSPESTGALIEAGAVVKPDWDVLYEGLPVLKRLRESHPEVPLASGEQLTDYCMVAAHNVWVLVYNTNRVKAEELKGLVWEDLGKPQWRNRVTIDNQAAGIYMFPQAPGWSEERMVNWVKALKANGAKAVAGASVGVLQAVAGGEADVAITTANVIPPAAKRGAPVDLFAPADGWLPGIISDGCLLKLTKADPALAQLANFWMLAEGRTLRDEFETSGSFLFSDSKNVVAEALARFGYDFSKAVIPSTEQERQRANDSRKLAIDTFTGN